MIELTLNAAAEKAADLIKQAHKVVAITGAGISTPSGIPDFRSAGSGLWTHEDPMQVASLSAFRYRPEKFFDWLRPLARKFLSAEPNPAHLALAKMEANGFLSALVTQNIDSLHQRAGSHNVVELHGTAASLTCPKCRSHYSISEFIEVFLEQENIPHCPRCQAILKPDIVLFEELLPVAAWQFAEDYCSQADLILVVGSSLEVTPAAHLPLYGLERGAKLMINTFSSTYLDERADLLLPFDVAAIMPAISDRLS